MAFPFAVPTFHPRGPSRAVGFCSLRQRVVSVPCGRKVRGAPDQGGGPHGRGHYLLGLRSRYGLGGGGLPKRQFGLDPERENCQCAGIGAFFPLPGQKEGQPHPLRSSRNAPCRTRLAVHGFWASGIEFSHPAGGGNLLSGSQCSGSSSVRHQHPGRLCLGGHGPRFGGRRASRPLVRSVGLAPTRPMGRPSSAPRCGPSVGCGSPVGGWRSHGCGRLPVHSAKRHVAHSGRRIGHSVFLVPDCSPRRGILGGAFV